VHARVPAWAEQEILARTILVERVRARLRDYAQLNTIVDGVEFSDVQIEQALLYALEEYNNSPPLIGRRSIRLHPHPALLMNGAIASLLMDASLFYARNDISYSAGTIQVGFPQAQTYFNMGERMMTQFKQDVVNRKTAENVDAASTLQVVTSDYHDIHSLNVRSLAP
jgi:hypothetical protein